jgi:hypothetical protein
MKKVTLTRTTFHSNPKFTPNSSRPFSKYEYELTICTKEISHPNKGTSRAQWRLNAVSAVKRSKFTALLKGAQQSAVKRSKAQQSAIKRNKTRG